MNLDETIAVVEEAVNAIEQRLINTLSGSEAWAFGQIHNVHRDYCAAAQYLDELKMRRDKTA